MKTLVQWKIVSYSDQSIYTSNDIEGVNQIVLCISIAEQSSMLKGEKI